MSRASDIAAAFATKIATIRVANGYSTDIGAQVFRGRANLSALDEDSDLPCTVIAEAEDRVEDQKSNLFKTKLAQRYIFEGHDECDPDHPNDKAHLIIADLKRVIFGVDPRLIATLGVPPAEALYEIRYVGRNIGVRPDGSAIVAASIEVEAVYAEDLSNP